MATIATLLSIDNVAAQSHQCPVFPLQVQWDGGYRETNFDSGASVVIVRVSATRLERHAQKRNGD